ncbi:MAG: hypothetical protein E6H85_10965 [Chloroflexi bacterium]|nr:MAG: hypothetical protein E6H85_10965 [Chloroflexota bacterium]
MGRTATRVWVPGRIPPRARGLPCPALRRSSRGRPPGCPGRPAAPCRRPARPSPSSLPICLLSACPSARRLCL